MRFTTSTTSFRSGRLSPKLFNRIDSEQYRDGASVMENCRPIPEGGAERLKGTRHVPIFTADFTGVKRRTFSISINATPIVIMLGQFSSNAVTMSIIPYPYQWDPSSLASETLIAAGATTYDVDLFDYAVVDNTLILTHFSGLMVPYYIKFASDYATTGDYEVTTLATLDPLKPFAGAMQMPMSDIGAEGSSITIGTYVPPAGLVLGYTPITSTDPAVQAIIQRSQVLYVEGKGKKTFGGNEYHFVVGNWYVYYDTHTNGAKFIPASYINDSGTYKDPLTWASLTTTDTWAYSMFWAGNCPKTVTTHEGRVVFGGTPTNPLTIFGSSTRDERRFNQLRVPVSGVTFFNAGSYSGDTLPTDPYIYKTATKEDTEITFLGSAQNLVIGTDRREYVASGGDTILSALSVSIQPQTGQGSSPVSSASNGSSVYYISGAGKKLFKFKYSESNGSFVSQELSLLFSDLLDEDRIKEIEWCPSTSSLMILMHSGKLYGIMDNEQAKSAAFYDTKVDGINSMAFVAAREEVEWHKGDHLFLWSDSALGFGTLTMEQTYYEKGVDSGVVTGDPSQNEYIYYDNAITVERLPGSGTFEINGKVITDASGDRFPIPLDMFPEDTEVMITNLTDMTTYTHTVGPQDVDMSDSHFLQWAAIDVAGINSGGSIVIGLPPREMKVATMPVEAGQQWGTAQMGIKNIDTIGVRFYKTYSYEISSDDTNWQEVNVTDEDVNCTTGRDEKKFTANPRYDQIVYIRNTRAEPCTILGINMRGVSNDG